MAQDSKQEWQWYSGPNDEYFVNGPFETREQAIAELDGYGGHIIEACKHAPVHFDAGMLLDQQYFDDNEDFDYDHSEPDRIGSSEVIAEADAELQALLNAWCDKHGHTFACGNQFRSTRNAEQIPANPQVSA